VPSSAQSSGADAPVEPGDRGAAGLVGLALLGVLAVTSAGGCRRSAPGPEECKTLALTAAGVSQREEVRSTALLEQVDTVTRECLVTPYDRTFIRCMEETRHYRGCRREFTRRRAGVALR
jgi:hypothetical protein